MQGDAKWHQKRAKCRATCSNYANALGLGHKSRKWYWDLKSGNRPEDPDNFFMKRGREKEEVVAELFWRWAHDSGLGDVQFDVEDFRFDPVDERFGGSVDRIIRWPDGHRSVLEIKTTSKDLDGVVPMAHNLQMCGLVHLYPDIHSAWYASYSYHDNSLFVCEISWTVGFFEKSILPLLRSFAQCVDSGIPPSPMHKEDKFLLYEHVVHHTNIGFKLNIK